MNNAKCIAYRNDGRICGALASILDPRRGGMVCAAHAPLDAINYDGSGGQPVAGAPDFSSSEPQARPPLEPEEFLSLDFDASTYTFKRTRFADGFDGYVLPDGLEVTVTLPEAEEGQMIHYHAELVPVKCFRARRYKVDSPGRMKILKTPLGPCVLVLAPFQH